MKTIKNFAYFVAVICFFGCANPSGSVLAITHVTVIDATGVPPQSDMTVLVANHQIAAVGPSQSVHVPSDAQIVDGGGKYLVPGLVDSHVHLTGAGEPNGDRKS